MEYTAEMVREWCNCQYADIDAVGDIWIADPQRGHWLSVDEKQAFYAWALKGNTP